MRFARACRSTRTAAAAALVALTLGAVSPGAGPAHAQSADSTETSAASDSSAVVRPIVSTDGAISVYEESRPGEGIEGFWWEYNPSADLARLTDLELRAERLEPIVDPFGFALAIPESIRALRDSVTAVADSILAETIEVDVHFDPKLVSRYSESKDVYRFRNKVESTVPLYSGGTVNTTVNDSEEFNESTAKSKTERSLSAAFNFRFSDDLVTSLTVSGTDQSQERESALESKSNTTGVQGRVRSTNEFGRIGKVESNVGVSFNTNDYQTRRTDGKSVSFSPSWGVKSTSKAGRSNIVIDYSGSLSRGDREEIQLVIADQDTTEELRESRDRNSKQRVTTSVETKLDENTTLRFNGAASLDRQQFLSQVDSLAGRQETRTITGQSVKANFTSNPLPTLEVRADGELGVNKRELDLDAIRFSRTKRRSAQTEFRYSPWDVTNVTVKLQRSFDENDYRTSQAGTNESQKAQIDFNQDVTPSVRFESGYLVNLDTKKFDDTELNTNDRDLKTQRGTFNVRYTPTTAFNAAVNMELRQLESVNIHPTKSGDNKTDYTYRIAPSYSLKIGPASINGEFSADANYGVFDFDEERNTLNRRFTTRQRWQQAVTTRLSAEITATYEYSDDGAWIRSDFDGRRRFQRAREIRRYNVQTKVLYNPTKAVKWTFEYRNFGDDQYVLSEDDRTLSSQPRTQQFTAGLRWRKPLSRSLSFDLDASQTQKSGDRVADVERRFYVISAVLEYQPFKRPAAAGGNGGGS